jgi:surfactin synthase thioesterase subunit
VITSMPELWFRRYASSEGARTTVFCFPHAGGSASYYYPMAAALAPEFDVLAVQYPGRQDRRREPLVTTIDELADQIHAAMRPFVTGPVALFGHSMGAVLAFEVSHRLEHFDGISPVVVFASGRRAPSRFRDDRVHQRDNAGLLAEIVNLGGTDSRVLAEAELLDMLLPPLRNDYRAIETYRQDPGVRISAPIVVMTATDDPRTSVDDARAWLDHTSGSGSVHLFEGGHFYLESRATQVVELVTRTLRAAHLG